MTEASCFTSRKVCVDGKMKQAWITHSQGKILEVLEKQPASFHGVVEDFGDLALLPGSVDTHVHVNEPGRTEWEGFESATHAAAAGGVTTLVDMPLNCIPVTTTVSAFQTKLDAIKSKLFVDVGFWGGAVPDQLKELPKLLESGVLGVKSFMIDSGIPEFPPMSLEDIDQAMPILAKYDFPYLFHAELDLDHRNRPQGPDYETFLKSRPKAWENEAIAQVIRMAEQHRARVHIVHLSSSEALPQIRKAKEEGMKITVETCPHYLLLNDHMVEEFAPEQEKTLFKCCPPIREEKNRLALWNGLREGVIDFIVSDHSPCTPALKRFDTSSFGDAWGGISSLQYTLPLLWMEARKNGVDLSKLSHWVSEAPAKMAGLSRKGRIAPGFDADFSVFDPMKSWTITPAETYHRHKNSPYQGRVVQGQIMSTILRGKKIYEKGTFQNKPEGRFLLRGEK